MEWPKALDMWILLVIHIETKYNIPKMKKDERWQMIINKRKTRNRWRNKLMTIELENGDM